MKFEIADWRFEVTWDGLLCQPIEREQAKAARKTADHREQRKGAGESARRAETQNFASTHFKQAQQKGATK
jgi:hypothetical protein